MWWSWVAILLLTLQPLFKVSKSNPIIEKLFLHLFLQSRHLLRGELNEAEDSWGIIETTITSVQCNFPVKRSQILCKAQLAASMPKYQELLCFHHCTIGRRRSTPELPYQPHKVQLSPCQEQPEAVSTMGIKPRKLLLLLLKRHHHLALLLFSESWQKSYLKICLKLCILCLRVC